MKNRILILKYQQRFRSESHNVFTEKVNKIVLSANDDEKIQSIDSIEAYAYRARKGQVFKKEGIKYNDIIRQYKKWLTLMMLKKKTLKGHNPNRPQIPDHPYRILMTGVSELGKTNSLWNVKFIYKLQIRVK